MEKENNNMTTGVNAEMNKINLEAIANARGISEDELVLALDICREQFNGFENETAHKLFGFLNVQELNKEWESRWKEFSNGKTDFQKKSIKDMMYVIKCLNKGHKFPLVPDMTQLMALSMIDQKEAKESLKYMMGDLHGDLCKLGDYSRFNEVYNFVELEGIIPLFNHGRCELHDSIKGNLIGYVENKEIIEKSRKLVNSEGYESDFRIESCIATLAKVRGNI